MTRRGTRARAAAPASSRPDVQLPATPELLMQVGTKSGSQGLRSPALTAGENEEDRGSRRRARGCVGGRGGRPNNPLHLSGQSKWFVSAQGYSHLNGFYESWNGGATWPVQGHVPGYEGWTNNTDPVGAFDPWGNFYSLLLPLVFVYSKSGGHVFNNGSKQANPGQPPEADRKSTRLNSSHTVISYAV